MRDPNVVVCSFFTNDDYYRGHADALRKNLDRLGLAYHLQEIEKQSGEDWADICRKKIAFLAGVCAEHPEKKVFWIDSDCVLLSLPDYIAEFTSDIIGFQRGFGSPMRIGYVNRTRFWEPCFVGINATPGGRKFIADAAELESDATIKATDDYFFEESWRGNAEDLSFQVIPSTAVLSRARGSSGAEVFFSFGSSGNVEHFKGHVEQHQAIGGSQRPPLSARARRRALKAAKQVERRLPESAANSIRKVADQAGITHLLTGGGPDGFSLGPAPSNAQRARMSREMIMSGQRGEAGRVEEVFGRLMASGAPSESEIALKRAADTFAHYAGLNPEKEPIKLVWWPRPFPGNFGDWLSPLILSKRTDHAIEYQSPTARSNGRHIVGVGSIGRFVRPSSIVVGTGISSEDIALETRAHYISVRGPITADLLKQSGGPVVDSFGDPGALITRIFPVEPGVTNGRVALIRHFTHANLPLQLPDHMDELSVLMSHPAAVESFVQQLNSYDAVVTSAMHVMIACHAYGIPSALITFEGFESLVHGTGIKYEDYSLGMGLSDVYEPVAVPPDLRRINLESMLAKECISEEKLDEIEQAVDRGVSAYLNIDG
jgi:hypothetical protein